MDQFLLSDSLFPHFSNFTVSLEEASHPLDGSPQLFVPLEKWLKPTRQSLNIIC